MASSESMESSGPSLAGTLFSGLLVFMIGAGLGLVSMISHPVETHQRVPDPEKVDPGTVVYVKGGLGGSTRWALKEKALLSDETADLELTEAELNAWSRERLEIKVPSSKEGGPGLLFLKAAPVNFRFYDDQVQLSTELELPGLISGMKVVYQVHGTFTAGADGLQFLPAKATLGSAPVGVLPFANNMLMKLVGKRFATLEGVEWLDEELGSIRSVQAGQGSIILQREPSA